MNKSMWELLIPIIANEGTPVAEALFQKWSSGTPPTQADFDELRAIGKQTALDRVNARLAANGISLSSDKAKQIEALTS